MMDEQSVHDYSAGMMKMLMMMVMMMID